MKNRDVIAGFMSGLGKMGDLIGTLLGEYNNSRERPLKLSLLGNEFNKNLHKDCADENSLDFKVSKVLGEVTGVSINIGSYGIVQGLFLLANAYYSTAYFKAPKIDNGKLKDED